MGHYEEYLERFMKEEPEEYKLYLRGRKLLEPYFDDKNSDFLELVPAEEGLFFSLLLFYAEEKGFLGEFTPEEMDIMILGHSFYSEEPIDDDIKRIMDKYFRITGNRLEIEIW